MDTEALVRRDSAEEAFLLAGEVVAAGQELMGNAVTLEREANEAAARGIRALVGQVELMRAAGPTGSAAPRLMRSPGRSWESAVQDLGGVVEELKTEPVPLAEQHTRDIRAGLGEAAWGLSAGALGGLLSIGPHPGHRSAARGIDALHDHLEDTYGADTSSRQYQEAHGKATIVSALVSGYGTARAALGITTVLRTARRSPDQPDPLAEFDPRPPTPSKLAEDADAPVTPAIDRSAPLVPGGRSLDQWDEIFQRRATTSTNEIRTYQLREQYAGESYDAVRRNIGVGDARAVSSASGFTDEEVEMIRHHIFVAEHPRSGTVARFDPQDAYANAWTRLMEGRSDPSDADWLSPELTEAIRMRDSPDLTYEEVHYQLLEEGHTFDLPAWQSMYRDE